MNNRHPLGQLIRSIQEAQGWSDRDLEARAVGKQGLGKSNLSKIKNHPISALKGSVIKGLSELLQVPESLIAKATLESMDISLSSQPAKTLEDAVRNEQELTAKERRILLAVVSEMRSEKEVVGNEQHPTHMTQAGESPAPQYDGPYRVAGLYPRSIRQARALLLRHGKDGFLGFDGAQKLFDSDEWMVGAKSISGDLENPVLQKQFKVAVKQLLHMTEALHEAHPEKPLDEVLDNVLEDILSGGPDGNPQGIDDFGNAKASASSGAKASSRKPYVDPHAHPDADAAGNIPLPANYYDLAADSSRNYGAEEDARAGERGEESQEDDI